MQAWLLVGIGGFIGAVSRFLLSGWFNERFSDFPLGTLVVNCLGSLALGMVIGSSWEDGFGENARLFLGVGMMGAFTTMSAFSYESIHLLGQGDIFRFAVYVLGTVLLCLLLVFIGFRVTSAIGQ